ncbi:MAG: thiamine-phosphate kinase [Sulfurospirillaceae bacterium]|nr:thiamine-phosphate kinase [Sulfurospirillaceae bacterium]
MDKEGFFIKQFTSGRIGDDGAVVGKYVYSKDLFCEGVHFLRSWMSEYDIAVKSMLVNISDAIAMNAKPSFALIGIVIPSNFELKQMRELARGFEDVAKKYGIEVIGGDTTSGEKLMISITIASHVEKPLFRNGMKIGDLVAYSGEIGRSKKELTRLLRGGKIGRNSRFITPKLRGDFVYEASRYMSAGLDISDGLSKDLSRMCKSSGKLGVRFLKKLPKILICSGEEYEMLFSFAPRYKAKILSIAKKNRLKINIFAKTLRKRYKSTCKENHFS